MSAPFLQTCFAAMASDDVRAKSSSGGAFTVFARWILARGGVVVGAAFVDQMECAYVAVEDEDGLKRLRGSKYVRAKLTKDVLEAIRRGLGANRPVLFSGVPCQVAAVKAMFGNAPGRLFCVDLVCNGAPKRAMFRKYLEENWGVDRVAGFEFRNKSRGWRFGHALLHVSLRDGTEEWRDSADDEYMQAYSRKYILEDGCFNCRFSGLGRPGDLTVCDYWKCPQEWDDGKGTSAIIVNSARGEMMMAAVAKDFVRLAEIKIDDVVRYQPRLRQTFGREVGMADFIKHVEAGMSMKDAVAKALSDVDRNVAVLNFHWETVNFGAVLTAYALNKGLRDMGFDVRNIDFKTDLPRVLRKPPNPEFDEFRRKYMPMTKRIESAGGLKSLNGRFGSFVVGSDQVWNPRITGWFRDAYFLMFATPDKRLVAAAASFGGDPVRAYGAGTLRKLAGAFDAVSVREPSACKALAAQGVSAKAVADPVFLLDRHSWLDLAATAKTPCGTGDVVLYAVNAYGKAGLADYCVSHAAELEGRLRRLDASVGVEDWLAAMSTASLVLTDSFHCTCFALIFERSFAVLASKGEKFVRLRDLLENLGLSSRIFDSADTMPDVGELQKPVDYSSIRSRLAEMRGELAACLKESLERPIAVTAQRVGARRRALKMLLRGEVATVLRRWARMLLSVAKLAVKSALCKNVERDVEDVRRRNDELCGRKSAVRRLRGYLEALGKWSR